MADHTHAGFVVFNRGQSDNESDIWDDSALIQAYDHAVSIMKAKMAEKDGGDMEEQASSSNNLCRKKSRKKRKKKVVKQKTRKWKVGDQCRAMFEEDGVVYEAVILSINHDDRSCFVRYLGYGNEERQSLSNLLPPSKNKHNSDVENQSDMEWCGQTRQSPSPHHHPSHTTSGSRAQDRHQPPSFSPAFSPGLSTWFGHHMGTTAPVSMRVPLVPPPPPPLLEDLSEVDSEALCSMLLAWYMSGYHTGYYQGVKQGRKDATAAYPPMPGR